MWETFVDIVRQSWLVLGQMAPYLLLGFAVAGVLSVWMSAAFIERHLGGRGMGPVVKSALFGVPLPLCSCGVIPVSASLRRHGASRAATSSFLLATPQTGVDSIAVTYGLLGPALAVFRPIAALVTGFVGGALVQLLGEPEEDTEPTSPADSPAAATTCTDNCCDTEESGGRLARAVRYGFLVLPRDIGGALLVGVLVSGVLSAVVPAGKVEEYLGPGIVSILAMIAVSIPLYVCATASVPIALGFIVIGVSPGAALAFLIAGPATNAATISTIWKVMGRKTTLVYLATVAVAAVTAGLLFNGLFPHAASMVAHHGTHGVEGAPIPWTSHLWAVALLGVMLVSSRPAARLLAQLTNKTEKDKEATTMAESEQRIELAVSGMTCSHCAESVRRALAECHGVTSSKVDLDAGRATVLGEYLDPAQLESAVSGIGYDAKTVEG